MKLGLIAYGIALLLTLNLLTGCTVHGSFGTDWYGKTFKQERSELLPPAGYDLIPSTKLNASESKNKLRY